MKKQTKQKRLQLDKFKVAKISKLGKKKIFGGGNPTMTTMTITDPTSGRPTTR